jgi:hypothetical protein
MPSSISCAQCGETITKEFRTDDQLLREPCPKCGSVARVYTENAGITASLGASGEEEVSTYPRVLLDSANAFHLNGHYNIAVIVAHMACEVAVERRLAEAFANQRISHLQGPIYELLNGFNLAGRKQILELYTALTGDEPDHQPFWQSFAESARRRNKIVHRGVFVSKADAELSLKATDEFLKHLGM